MQVQVLQHRGGFTGSARVALGDVLEADSAHLSTIRQQYFLPTEFGGSPESEVNSLEAARWDSERSWVRQSFLQPGVTAWC
jgi:hypothetical protein